MLRGEGTQVLGTTHPRHSHLSPQPQGPMLFLGLPSGYPRQGEPQPAQLQFHFTSMETKDTWFPGLGRAPGTSSPSPDTSLSSGNSRCWAPQKGELCGRWPSPRPRAALPLQGDAAPEPHENWMGRASEVCPQATILAPRPLHSPKMRFPVSGPLLLSLLSKHEKTASPPAGGSWKASQEVRPTLQAPLPRPLLARLRSPPPRLPGSCRCWTPPSTTTLPPALAELAARGTWTISIWKGNPVTSSSQG